jgi:hypothetical protein
LVFLILAGLTGCGSDALSSPTAANLRKLANLYLDLAASQRGQGPARQEDFQKYVRGLPDQILRIKDIDPKDRDALFVSGRDGQPFVIVYGVGISGMSPTKAPLVAYEQTGKAGKRLVAYANTKVEEVGEAKLQELTGTGS